MTWEEANASLQLASEERVGALAQMQMDLVLAQQSAAAAGLRAAVEKGKP